MQIASNMNGNPVQISYPKIHPMRPSIDGFASKVTMLRHSYQGEITAEVYNKRYRAACDSLLAAIEKYRRGVFPAF